jgi:hypothetical protein
MPKANVLNKSVPRVEYDHRAREARRQLEHIERPLVKRQATTRSQPYRLFRLLAFSVSGSGGRTDRRTGSPSDRRPCRIPVPLPVG